MKKSIIPSIEFSVWERKLLLIVVDYAILIASLIVYFSGIYRKDFSIDVLVYDYEGVIYGVMLFGLLASVLNFYDLVYASKIKNIIPQVFSVALLFSLLFVFTPIVTPPLPSRRIIILSFVFSFVFGLIIWRLFFAYIIATSSFHKKIIIFTFADISRSDMYNMKYIIEGDRMTNGYEVKRFYNLPDNDCVEFYKMINKVVDKKMIDNIVILDAGNKDIPVWFNKTLIRAMQKGVEVQTYINLYEDLVEAIPLDIIGSRFYSMFLVSRSNYNYFYRGFRKGVDLVFSILIGIIFIAMIPIIWILNLFFNKGPLFYTQSRIGKGGEEYKMYKFRSMLVHSEKEHSLYVQKNDIRLTKFGKLIRKLRVDELPQIYNVIKGNMSLIGPRAEWVNLGREYQKKIPFYAVRYSIKPGITGWAQVKYKYGENLDDSMKKLEYDLYYIKNRSVIIDIKIIMKTINTVIFSRGQ